MRIQYTLPLLLAAASSAHKFALRRIKQPSTTGIVQRSPADPSSGGLPIVTSDPASGYSLGSIHDLIYLTNITVGGQQYSVQLDTGSSDLWIKGDVHPLPGSTSTSINVNITYALGWAAGTVAYAPVEFMSLKVPKQAFVDVTDAVNPVLGYDLDGIVGLGFTSFSGVDNGVNKTSSDAGRSLLYNMFALNPSEPNFLAFSLNRGTDDDTVGSFSIGEYEPMYAAVANTTQIPTWPPRMPQQWTVLLDSLIVNSTIIRPTTSVFGAPSNKAVVLMDSGSSYSYVPSYVADAIYANITGAHFDSKSNQWVVPCDQEIDMALQIGGRVFPMYPLDVAPTAMGDNSTCLGTFIPSQPKEDSQFDWLVGDNFLRSVYAVYDFGDYDDSGKMGDPYMRMLSIVNPDEASIDFHQERGGTPRTNITYKGLDNVEAAPSFFISKDISGDIEMISKFVPAMLAIIALNSLILLVLVIGGLFYWMRKRSRASRNRIPRGRTTPMELNPVSSYIAGRSPTTPSGTHTYEPVSMALTEDTFVPPSPAFRKFDGQSGERPKSIA